MSDFEIDDIRRIRHEISAKHDHDLRKLAEHYRKLEKGLRESGRFKFADDKTRKPQAVNTEDAI